MDPEVPKLVNLARFWTCRPLIRPIIHKRVMLEGPESPKSPHKLVQPENVSMSVFCMVFLGEMDPEVVKLVNFAQIWTCRPLIGPINHQRGMIEAPELPKSPHKLVQPGNVSIRAFCMVILGEVDLKVEELVNVAHIWTYRLLKRPIIWQWDILEGSTTR